VDLERTGTGPDRMTATSWVPGADGSAFGIHALPYGVLTTTAEPARRRLGVAIGGWVLDLAGLARTAGHAAVDELAAPTLNPLLARGPQTWAAVRAWLTDLLADEAHREVVEPHLLARSEVALHLPFEVADYVDFYASPHHARNVGQIFRPGREPILPNWHHLPIGYHGRSATVVVSGTPIRRPRGQRPGPDGPTFGPSEDLDLEVEVGFVVGVPSVMGEPIPVGDFARHVFGVCLVNDWSARDLQRWESQPLGPFLGKSFATSVSPWVLPLAALEAARVDPPAREVEEQDYLREDAAWGLDVDLELDLNGTVISRPPFATMYWTGAQQLAHLTVNGAAVRTGDLYASGTVSGPEKAQRGCLLELSWGGAEEIALGGGAMRTYLHDGDTVTIRATAPGPEGTRIGFGEVTGTIHPALPSGL
jgi:fumarylacetoacetase